LKQKGKFHQKLNYNTFGYEEIKKLNKIDPKAVVEIFESDNCEKTDEIKKEYLRVSFRKIKKIENYMKRQFIQCI